MAYYPDLSVWRATNPTDVDEGTADASEALRESPLVTVILSVGWLDAHHPFPAYTAKSAVSEGITATFLDTLYALCCLPVQRSRGVVRCPLCDKVPVVARHAGRTRMLGAAQIEVLGQEGVGYRAPDLIFH